MSEKNYTLEDFFASYPEISDKDFNKKIWAKKEFRDIKVTKQESPPSKGELFSYQKLVSRLFSSYTPYDRALFFHAPGSGKTCTTIGLISKVISENNGIDKWIVVVDNKALKKAFKDELQKCGNSSFLETKGEVQLYSTFLKRQKRPYYNTIICLDEIHGRRDDSNVKGKNDEEEDDKKDEEEYEEEEEEEEEEEMEVKNTNKKKTKYEEISAIIDKTVNCKVVLLTGTPMFDNAYEIASIINFLLPVDERLSTGAEFMNKYFDASNNLKNKESLIKKFTGKVSYIGGNNDPNVILKYIGTNNAEKRKFIINEIEMSKLQSEIYATEVNKIMLNKSTKIKIEDLLGDVSTALSSIGDIVVPELNDRDKAGLFSFNETKFHYGPSVANNLDIGKGVNTTFSLLFKNLNDDKAKLEKLKLYSTKYAASIENILNAQNSETKKGKNVFVFNSRLTGGGLSSFAAILKFFGYRQLDNFDSNLDKRKRFIFLNGQTKNINDLVRLFNDPKNLHGEYIQVILGTEAVSQGLSFFNVQIIDIHSAWFNFSRTSQAIARGIRQLSHEQLIKENNGKVTVEIYLRAAILPKNNPLYENLPSVDINTYKVAEEKDIKIKLIERLLKENAIDSHFLFEKNKTTEVDKDFSRQCEYLKCNFKPFEGKETFNDSIKMDLSTYNMYYSRKEEFDLIHAIKRKLNDEKNSNQIKIKDLIDANEIRKIIGTNDFLFYKSLNSLLNTVPSFYRENYKLFLKEKNNLLYLVNENTDTSNPYDTFYVNFNKKENKVSEEVKKQEEKEEEQKEEEDEQGAIDLTKFVNLSGEKKVKLLQRLLLVKNLSEDDQRLLNYFNGFYIKKNSEGNTVEIYEWFPKNENNGYVNKVTQTNQIVVKKYDNSTEKWIQQSDASVAKEYLKARYDEMITKNENIKIYGQIEYELDTKKIGYQNIKLVEINRGPILQDTRKEKKGTNCGNQFFVSEDGKQNEFLLETLKAIDIQKYNDLKVKIDDGNQNDGKQKQLATEKCKVFTTALIEHNKIFPKIQRTFFI